MRVGHQIKYMRTRLKMLIKFLYLCIKDVMECGIFDQFSKIILNQAFMNRGPINQCRIVEISTLFGYYRSHAEMN